MIQSKTRFAILADPGKSQTALGLAACVGTYFMGVSLSTAGP